MATIEEFDDEERESLTKKQIKSVFKSFDTDSSGYIEQRELRNVFKKLGVDKGISEAVLLEALRQLDTNRDGKIDFPEFYTWMKTYFEPMIAFDDYESDDENDMD